MPIEYTPWPAELAAAYRRLGYWEDKTVPEAIYETVRRHPDDPALIHDSQTLTYGQLWKLSGRLALHLAGLGFGPGQTVVMQLPNTPEFVISYLALLRIGVVPVMALPAHRETEISYFLAHAGAIGYLVPSELRGFSYLDLAVQVAEKAGRPIKILASGLGSGEHPALPNGTSLISLDSLIQTPVPGEEAGEEVPDPRLASLRPDPSDVALMLLSGGTTALPKLIARTHNDYVYNARGSAPICGVDAKTVFLAVLPLAHNFTLASPGIQSVLLEGGKVVLTTANDPETVFDLIERHRITHISAVTPLIARWLASPSLTGRDFSSLKVIQNGGARLAPELRARLKAAFGCQFQEVYGMSEGLLNYTWLDDPEELILNSSGRPMSPHDEVRVVDEEGNDVPTGQMGELWTRGPYTIRGYYKVPEHNAKAFSPDGFYKSGDLVTMDAQGNLCVVGRRKDFINRGGEKISAEEVESLVLKHPAVANAAAVPMPDPELGERTCLYVMPREGHSLTLPEICSFLLQQGIAKFKLPERLEVLPQFPLSPAGKILKRALQDEIEAKVKAGRAG